MRQYSVVCLELQFARAAVLVRQAAASYKAFGSQC
jgi:hypothetical protein